MSVRNLFTKFRTSGLLFLNILLSIQVLGQYNVTVTSDGMATNQLRGAILAADAAGGSSTINVAAGTYNITMGEIIFGSQPQNITITGAGASSTIINMTSAAQDRIFLINTTGENLNIQTTITGLTFTGGHPTTDLFFGGGAITCGGPGNSTTINNCVFNNNTSADGQNGGAIYMAGSGSLSLNQCRFTNNVCPTGAGGALYYFKNNAVGGVNVSGSLSVTNCTFDNNSATASGSGGGALYIAVQGMLGSTTSVISIFRNTFTNNHANTNGSGGAISITNSFSSTNTAFINYNRFASNTATNGNTSALAMAITQGSVDATNNWWGCNTGATSCADRAAMLPGTPAVGTLDADPWLQLSATAGSPNVCSGSSGNTNIITASFLRNSAGTAIPSSNLTAFTGLPVSFTASLGSLSGGQAIQSSGTATVTYTTNGTAGTGTVNAVVDNVPSNESTPARASFTVNASPVITTAPASSNSCSGNNASFTVVAGGAPTYQWFKGATLLTNGPRGTGSTISGATTATLNIQNPSPSDNAADYKVVVNNGCQTTSGNVTLTVAPLALPSSTTTITSSVSAASPAINDGSCQRIVNVLPSGGVPVAGSVTARVTIDASQPFYNGEPYVIRHYDISPATTPNTATATITLYFLQSEFDAYNAARPGTISDLPAGPSDVAGRGNLRVTQFHGTGTAPGNYTGWGGVGPATVLINPGLTNVIWNATRNLWEVTFNVTGFSGFYITGLVLFALPLQLESFTGTSQGAGVLLNWQVSGETNLARYEVETSSDGVHFNTIQHVTANSNRSYNFLYGKPLNGLNYYRLKIIDDDGTYVYSNVIAMDVTKPSNSFRVLPNPFHSKLQVQVEVTKRTSTVLILTDLSGKVLLKQRSILTPGVNTLMLDQLNRLTKGTYLLNIVNDEMNKTLKVIKAG